METPYADEPTSPSLLLRLRDPANADAWSTFVSAYAPLVYGYCRKSGLQDADAADIGQEVLNSVLRSIRSFAYDPERGRFRDWLRTIARRRVMRFLARKARTAGVVTGSEPIEQVAVAAADAEWADDFHAQVLRVALEQVRSRYEPTTWRAFERTWVDRADACAVAHELGLAIDLVYSAKSRVLKQLRAQVLMLAEDVTLFVPLDT